MTSPVSSLVKTPLGRHEYPEGLMTLSKCGSRAECPKKPVYELLFRYKTHQYYNFNKPPEVLHAWAAQFTQMVWVNTTKFGCGKARSRTGKIIVVANYLPRGNIPSVFHLNVLPPSDTEAPDEASAVSDTNQQDDGNGSLASKLTRMFQRNKKT